MSDTDLKEKEEAAIDPGSFEDEFGQDFDDAETSRLNDLSDQLGGGYNPGGGKTKVTGKGLRAKKTLVAVALTAALGVGGFTIVSGPLKFLHLSQILSIANFSNQENSSDTRLRGLYKYVRTGEVGYTRVGYLGEKMHPRITANLAKSGIEIRPSKVVGQAGKIIIDTSKHPDYKGLKGAEAIERIAADNGVDQKNIQRISGASGAGDKISMNIKDEKITAKRAVLKQHVKAQGLGKAASAIHFRHLTKFYDAPSWLHPLKKASTTADRKLSNALLKSQKYREFREKRQAKIKARTPAAEARMASIKSKLGVGAGVTGAALLGHLAVCTARDIAKEIPEINRENIVIPAMKSGVDLVAIGAQVQSGQDLDFEQLGEISNNMEDESGKSIFEAKAIQAEMGNEGGVDIDKGTKDAFSPNSSSSNVTKALDDTFQADKLCSGTGKAIGLVAGVGLFLVPGAGIVAKATSAAVGAAAISAITILAPQLLADDPANFTPHQGPTGGNIDAYGVREAAGASFRAAGGSALSTQQSAELRNEQDEANMEEFAGRSFTDRVFDVTDYRSIASRLIDKSPANLSQPSRGLENIASLPQSLFKNFSATFNQKAYANNVGYDYGFPQYGFAKAQLENGPAEDPYENANQVAALMETESGQKLRDRAKACYGVSISKGTQGWDAVPPGDVNPAGDDYISANCNDASTDWLKLRFFIFDLTTMTSYACYEGDEESCSIIFGKSQASNPSTTTVTNGFNFPLRVTKEIIKTNPGGAAKWCMEATANCHHDYNAADIHVPTGTPVLAARAGKVISAKFSEKVGSTVQIKATTGELTYYAHMGEGTLKVTAGQDVVAGQEIGLVGTDANAINTDHHLHIDELPSNYAARPGCSAEACTPYPFVDIQPKLAELFNALP